MSSSLKFYLPLPNKVLSSNGRTRNYGYRAKLVADARKEAKAEAERVLADAGAPPPLWENARYSVAFFIGSRRKEQDPANVPAWLKAYIDGIGDAGIFKNDRRLHIDTKDITWTKVDKMPRVEITIAPEE